MKIRLVVLALMLTMIAGAWEVPQPELDCAYGQEQRVFVVLSIPIFNVWTGWAWIDIVLYAAPTCRAAGPMPAQ